MGCERVRIWIWCRRNIRESLGQSLSGCYQEHGWEVRICHLSWWRSGKRRRAARTAHWNRHCCIGYGRGWCKVWWTRWIGKTIWIVWWRWGVVIKRCRISWWCNGTRTRAGFWVVNRWGCWCIFSRKCWWWNGKGTGVGYWLVDSRWRRWESLWFEALGVLNIEKSLGFFWRKSHELTRVGEALLLFINYSHRLITIKMLCRELHFNIASIQAVFWTFSTLLQAHLFSNICISEISSSFWLERWSSASNIMPVIIIISK